jgi:hypothetical protein
VSKTVTVREAKLRTKRAALHPTLPVHRWTSAASLAHLVASTQEERTGARPLLDADFEFRGGSRRWVAGWIARTRTGEMALNS